MESARSGLIGVDVGADVERRPAPAPTPVGIGGLEVAPAPAVLIAIGLGSCVGVALYDARARVGALAHVFLPEAPMGTQPGMSGTDARARDGDVPAKFADAAIPESVNRIVALGAAQYRLWAKMAGGARVLTPLAPTNGAQDIGSRNVDTVRRLLESMRIPIVGEAVGGDAGRTLRFDVATGIVEIRSHGRRVGDI